RTLGEVAGRLGREYPLVIGGAHVHTEERLDSLDPCFPDRVVGRASMATSEHVEAAFDAAYAALEEWSRRDMADRARHLVKLAAIMRRRHAELAAWEVYEAAKNYLEASADVAGWRRGQHGARAAVAQSAGDRGGVRGDGAGGRPAAGRDHPAAGRRRRHRRRARPPPAHPPHQLQRLCPHGPAPQRARREAA